jgi:hypothetical protein
MSSTKPATKVKKRRLFNLIVGFQARKEAKNQEVLATLLEHASAYCATRTSTNA